MMQGAALFISVKTTPEPPRSASINRNDSHRFLHPLLSHPSSLVHHLNPFPARTLARHGQHMYEDHVHLYAFPDAIL